MGKITTARAYANNEVAFLAWTLDGMVDDCLGFEITRIYVDTGEERVLAAWVPFKGQSNPDWKPQTTSVWPVQKLTWRDLTLRKRRDRVSRRRDDVKVKYRIRTLVRHKPGLEPATNLPEQTYEGKPLPLAYLDQGLETNEVLVTTKYGDVRAAFTNGILSGQWLKNALEDRGEELTAKVVGDHIATPGDPLRKYLTGEVLGLLRELLERAGEEPGAEVRLALYELSDKELKDLIVENKTKVRLILSNSGKGKTNAWDEGNGPFRKELMDTPGLEIHNRMFNNNHIGHNKFAVLIGADGQPRAVMTGSTNWTSTGLCGQSNNAVIIESPEVAQLFLDYWDRLLEDTKSFKVPDPLSQPTNNAQGPELRTANAQGSKEIVLADGTRITVWYAPNTVAKSKKDEIPPDLAAVYRWMRKVDKTILFAAFLPSLSGKTSIIEEAISLGLKDPSLLVYGSVSDPTAMPNYVPPEKKAGEDVETDNPEKKTQPPAVFDKGRIHIVRAVALTKNDIVGGFESELLKVGHAIIHDKIVVIDPLSENGTVILGSHNLGFKASYENDENFVIVRGNRKLIEAYAVHVLDVYDHYRFRAVQQELRAKGKKGWDGFLSRDSKWLKRYLTSEDGDLARYFSGRVAEQLAPLENVARRNLVR